LEWSNLRSDSYFDKDLPVHLRLPSLPHNDCFPPPVPRFVLTPSASDNHLAVIDLAEMDTPEGKVKLADEARTAMKDKDFFYVINHGLAEEQTSRMFDIANIPLSQVSDAEKTKFIGKMQQTGRIKGTSNASTG